MQFQKKFLFLFFVSAILFFSCKNNSKQINSEIIQQELKEILETQELNSEQRYTAINQMANSLLGEKKYQDIILFLTSYVEQNPDDIYNSYWLLMTAYVYLSTGAEPMAEYYFDRILQDYDDLYVKGNSIHFLCLQNLIQISKTPTHRINYFNQLINRFPQNVNTTELYYRLALEYENDNQWSQVLKTYTLFLEQPDASIIQIPGEPDAYNNARHLVDFNNSSKDWTFETLPELEAAVKKAIRNYDWRTLDKYKAKVNFFSMSWRQNETDPNSQEDFSTRDYAYGRRIRYSDSLDEASNPNEAYLRTTGWSTYVSVWYLYFRKINYPLDPDINGNWEWAGIYIGNKV